MMLVLQQIKNIGANSKIRITIKRLFTILILIIIIIIIFNSSFVCTVMGPSCGITDVL